MPAMIFVDLSVTEVARSTAFDTGLGYAANPAFSDETTTCIVVSDTICFGVMTRERFAGFSPRPVGDPARETGVLIALTQDSRAAVDAFVAAALAHGGSDNAKVPDHGFMYRQSVSDPDGNVLDVVRIDLAAVTGHA